MSHDVSTRLAHAFEPDAKARLVATADDPDAARKLREGLRHDVRKASRDAPADLQRLRRVEAW